MLPPKMRLQLALRFGDLPVNSRNRLIEFKLPRSVTLVRSREASCLQRRVWTDYSKSVKTRFSLVVGCRASVTPIP